jgi:lantibiotic leader peptide-processing serine protease
MTFCSPAKRAPWLISLCLTLPACAAELAVEPTDLDEKSAAVIEPQTFLVLYRLESVPRSAAADVTKAGGTLVASYPELGVAIARSSSSTFASALAKNLLVHTVAPTQGAGVDSLPSELSHAKLAQRVAAPASGEPLAPMQWNMAQIHAAEARAITPGKKSVVVGVFDSGIDDSLPDLVGQVDAARSVTCIGGVANTDPAVWRYDAIGHGSHVAGIIGAKENGVGVVGVAPGATLAAVKLTEDGFIYPEAFVCGLYWAATHDFDLVNASLFIDPYYYNCKSDPVQRAITIAEQRAVAFAARKGVTVIAASSNEQQDLANPTSDPFSPTNGETVPRTVDNSCKLLPVELTGVIGVSAVDAHRNLSYYSNHGFGVIDLSAPGGDFHVPTPGNESGQIVSSIPAYSYYYQIANEWNGRVGIGCSDGLDPNDPAADPATCKETYALLQGTSQATPHVTGVAALALSRYGKLPAPLLLAKLAASATKLACPAGGSYQPYPEEMDALTCQGTKLYNGFYGSGEVDALATVK